MANFDTYQGTADSAKQTGQNAINAFDPTATANTARGGFNTLTSQQQQTGQGFANNYASQVAANPDVTSLYSKANEAFGVPQLNQQAAYLQNQVTNQLPMQQNLMRGFDASQGQVDNATNYNLRFLQPQATAATNMAQQAQTLAGQQVQAGITQNQMNLLPVQAQQQMLQQTLAGQMTGYNTAAQAEMNGLMQKMQSGVQLSTNEMNRANQLAQMEASYNSAIQSQTIASQNQQIKAGDTYYNPVTKAFYNPTTKVSKPA